MTIFSKLFNKNSFANQQSRLEVLEKKADEALLRGYIELALVS